MNFTLPGSQWAYGIILCACVLLVTAVIGIAVGQMFEVKEKGKVKNPVTCLAVWAIVQGLLLYALSPVVVGLIQWADKVVKGG